MTSPNGGKKIDINVDEVMTRIRSRIEEKKQSGRYSPEELKAIEQVTLKITAENTNESDGDLQYRLSQLNYLCDTGKPPEFSTHRKVLGSLVIGLKKALRKITEPYIQTILKRQIDFNVELVRLLNQMAMDNHYRWDTQEKQIARLEKKWAQTTKSLEAIPQELRTQKNIFEEVLNDLKLKKGQPDQIEAEGAERLRSMVREPEYLDFEEKHRGSREEIKWKQKSYLPYFKDKGPVLDIGCGRGEFLEILKEARIRAFGVDSNQEMVRKCLAEGLEAFQADGLEYLRSLPDHSQGGIFLSQVIEHLNPEALRELARVSFLKLVPEGIFLAETINPQCLSTFSGAFYLDLSHQKPIHPEAACFLLESAGFRQVRLLYGSPYPPEMKLKEMIRREDDSYEDELARVFNENSQRLNALLYGFQDYAVLGYK
jgi:SAM-dependent methyltransferase